MRVYKSTQFSVKFTTLQFPSREMLRMKDSFENQPGLVLQFVALNHHSTSSRSFFNTVSSEIDDEDCSKRSNRFSVGPSLLRLGCAN
ncbi:hypothetical protein ANTRET_LOCUS6403 [Anthophora retusa]